MGCMLRSDKMSLYEIYLQPETAFEVISRFGENGNVQFIDNVVEKWEGDVYDMSENQTILLANLMHLKEMYYAISSLGDILGDAEINKESFFGKNRCLPFEMMLWRVSRGNIFYRQASEDAVFTDPQTGQGIRKIAFVAVCQGETLSGRLEKVCSGFRTNIFSSPETVEERMDMLYKLDTRITDLEKVIKKTKFHRCKALCTVARQLRMWSFQVRKSKAVYNIMNMFSLDITKKCLIGRIWVPDLDVPAAHDMLEQSSEKTESNVPSFMSKIETSSVPPTYHRTNKFTNGFQALINAYGDSEYRELNPGLYTIITFPFLFAVMFGDVCHGIILLSFAGWMISIEKQYMSRPSNNEIWNIFFGEIENNQYLTLNPVFETNDPYLFGVDPLWALAKNKIMYLNSLKMKLSIIIGIIHMIFGLTLSLFNHIYFRRNYAIILEFIPQMNGAGCAPLILIYFIDMVLMSTTKPVEDECDAYMFEGQKTLQTCLVIISLSCVPVMLFGSPIYKNMMNKRIERERSGTKYKSTKFRKYQKNKAIGNEHQENDPDPEHHSYGELQIHQAVHTIEFVLSTISHTASYLRLWALSLAHEQLSEMLWVMILAKLALRVTNIWGSLRIFVIFAIWAVFTLSILVVMEGLSAFLHTLRLHWVEFMSKFYYGSGHPFKPFSFRTVLFGDGISYVYLHKYKLLFKSSNYDEFNFVEWLIKKC
ncbi:unnamed protein product, partial [Leptidea sinapis]